MGEFVDSKQLRFDRSRISCGVLDAHHIPDVGGRKNAYAIANALYHKANPRPACFILFSDVVRKNGDGRGQELANFLTGVCPCIGAVLASSKEVNPRTGNVIQVWLFTPTHDAFRKWYTEETMHRVEE